MQSICLSLFLSAYFLKVPHCPAKSIICEFVVLICKIKVSSWESMDWVGILLTNLAW